MRMKIKKPSQKVWKYLLAALIAVTLVSVIFFPNLGAGSNQSQSYSEFISQVEKKM